MTNIIVDDESDAKHDNNGDEEELMMTTVDDDDDMRSHYPHEQLLQLWIPIFLHHIQSLSIVNLSRSKVVDSSSLIDLAISTTLSFVPLFGFFSTIETVSNLDKSMLVMFNSSGGSRLLVRVVLLWSFLNLFGHWRCFLMLFGHFENLEKWLK
jgi:hypothetical protein